MCLSPEVDLAAAVVTGVVAVDTFRRNHNPDARLLASIPAIFAFHNVVSALMWWGLLGELSDNIANPATWIYEFIAFVLWPIYVPLAVRKMETNSTRIRIMTAVLALGVINSGWHMWRLVSGDISAHAHDMFISFNYPTDPTIVGAFYIIATCGVTLFSSHKELVYWGIANALVVAVLGLWTANGLPSLWCWYAALTSVYLNVFIRRHDRQRRELTN